jgi:hypothetical protein
MEQPNGREVESQPIDYECYIAEYCNDPERDHPFHAKSQEYQTSGEIAEGVPVGHGELCSRTRRSTSNRK